MTDPTPEWITLPADRIGWTRLVARYRGRSWRCPQNVNATPHGRR